MYFLKTYSAKYGLGQLACVRAANIIARLWVSNDTNEKQRAFLYVHYIGIILYDI